jgi:hypothetical protein
LAGLFAFTPVRLRLEDQLVAATHGHHLALKSAHQGGIAFIALSRYALRAEASQGMKMVIGLPNRKSYQAHKFLMKWTDFGFLDCLYKVSPLPRPHHCRQVALFPDHFEPFYSRVAKSLDFYCEKTVKWMNWRFCERPGAPYTVYAIEDGDGWVGYVVLKSWQEPDGYRKAHIVDLHALDEAALSHLVAAAECYAVNCNELNLWAIQGYPYRNFLERMGFGSRDAVPQPLAVRTLDGSSVEFPNGNASFSYGDGDTVY